MDAAAAGAASSEVTVQPAATVQVDAPPAAAEQAPSVETPPPAAAAPSPDDDVHGASPHAPAPAASLQLDSAAHAALAGSPAAAQQLGSPSDPGADPVEAGPTDSNADWPMAAPDWLRRLLEVSLAAAMMCRHLCTAGPPDSRKGAQACTAGRSLEQACLACVPSGQSAGSRLADEPAHPAHPALCLCVQEDEPATKQNSAQPEGRAEWATEADTIDLATPAAGSQQGEADPRYAQPLMAGPHCRAPPEVHLPGPGHSA